MLKDKKKKNKTKFYYINKKLNAVEPALKMNLVGVLKIQLKTLFRRSLYRCENRNHLLHVFISSFCSFK